VLSLYVAYYWYLVVVPVLYHDENDHDDDNYKMESSTVGLLIVRDGIVELYSSLVDRVRHTYDTYRSVDLYGPMSISSIVVVHVSRIVRMSRCRNCNCC
jgi:hypothetical protein